MRVTLARIAPSRCVHLTALITVLALRVIVIVSRAGLARIVPPNLVEIALVTEVVTLLENASATTGFTVLCVKPSLVQDSPMRSATTEECVSTVAVFVQLGSLGMTALVHVHQHSVRQRELYALTGASAWVTVAHASQHGQARIATSKHALASAMPVERAKTELVSANLLSPEMNARSHRLRRLLNVRAP